MTDKTFQLDTSGEVALSIANGVPFEIAGGYEWDYLTPFQQGYIQAMFADQVCEFGSPYVAHKIDDGLTRWRRVGFSDLSPAALAMILKDCEKAQHPDWTYGVRDGAQFWKDRQAGKWATMPPYRITLGEDGKVNVEVAS